MVLHFDKRCTMRCANPLQADRLEPRTGKILPRFGKLKHDRGWQRRQRFKFPLRYGTEKDDAVLVLDQNRIMVGLPRQRHLVEIDFGGNHADHSTSVD